MTAPRIFGKENTYTVDENETNSSMQGNDCEHSPGPSPMYKDVNELITAMLARWSPMDIQERTGLNEAQLSEGLNDCGKITVKHIFLIGQLMNVSEETVIFLFLEHFRGWDKGRV